MVECGGNRVVCDRSRLTCIVDAVAGDTRRRLSESGEGVPGQNQIFLAVGARKLWRRKSGSCPAAGVCSARGGGPLAGGGRAFWLADTLGGGPGWARAIGMQTCIAS